MSTDRVSAALRRIVATRANGYCEYCQCPENFATESFTVEHINPRQAGGATVLENLAWSCFGCNGHKHAKTQGIDPETSLPSPLFHPRQQTWIDHFGWNNDFSQILGKTPCGRATVAALHLNRTGITNLR
jgi:5-methylcytosine-specific restriction endonuclease McrA